MGSRIAIALATSRHVLKPPFFFDRPLSNINSLLSMIRRPTGNVDCAWPSSQKRVAISLLGWLSSIVPFFFTNVATVVSIYQFCPNRRVHSTPYGWKCSRIIDAFLVSKNDAVCSNSILVAFSHFWTAFVSARFVTWRTWAEQRNLFQQTWFHPAIAATAGKWHLVSLTFLDIPASCASLNILMTCSGWWLAGHIFFELF